MREIKFRGKSLETGLWFYGTYVWESNRHYIARTCDVNVWELVDQKTVGQFTGLKDKNEIEIYEGDICRWKTDGFKTWCESNIPIGEVKFDGGCFELCRDNFSLPPAIGSIRNFLEIIGNITDNKELLK